MIIWKIIILYDEIYADEVRRYVLKHFKHLYAFNSVMFIVKKLSMPDVLRYLWYLPPSNYGTLFVLAQCIRETSFVVISSRMVIIYRL